MVLEIAIMRASNTKFASTYGNVQLTEHYPLRFRSKIRMGLIEMLESLVAKQPTDDPTDTPLEFVELPDFLPKLLHVEETKVQQMSNIQFNAMRAVRLHLVRDKTLVFWKISEICVVEEFSTVPVFPCEPASIILVAFSEPLQTQEFTFMSMQIG